jgi:quercetin dioxygenase-like cupin family protein
VSGEGDELGGDPACWAHLFADAIAATATAAVDDLVVDLAAVARAPACQGVAWSSQSDDLSANLLVFASGDGIQPHVNEEVDVLIVAIAGEGVISIGETRRPFRAGQAILIPKGVQRGITSASDPFAYLTCHHRRAGLRPVSRS